MKKSLLFVGIIVILIIGGVLISQFEKKNTMAKTLKNSERKQVLSGVSKKVAMIVAFRDFRDVEYFLPKKILEEAGLEVKTASNKIGIAIGADGGDTDVDLLISELDPADFDAIVFVGGPGCLKNLDNEDSYKIARETVSQNKVLGSICISPVILAKSGVLSGKKATVWSSVMDRSPIKILEENGAIYQDKEVVVDGKIITANGPDAAQKFAETIIEILK